MGKWGAMKIGKDGDQNNADEKKQSHDGAAIFTEIGPEFSELGAESCRAIIYCLNYFHCFLHGCFGHGHFIET